MTAIIASMMPVMHVGGWTHLTDLIDPIYKRKVGTSFLGGSHFYQSNGKLKLQSHAQFDDRNT
jgi:hypothetical protein